MNRRVVAFLLVAAALGAQGAHVDNHAQELEDTDCMSCHFEGGSGFGPALKEMFRIQPVPLELAVGEDGVLEVDVRNWWTAELSRFEARLDLGGADALVFADMPEDILDQTVSGVLPYDVLEIDQPERAERVRFTVPVGGTHLDVQLAPDRTDGAQAPDLELRVWPPGADVEDEPAFMVNAAGAGAAEVLPLTGDPIPSGTWTIEVAQEGFLASPDQSQLVSQPFTVTWGLRYEYDDPIRFAVSDDVLDGQEPDTPQTTRIAWPVRLDAPIERTQRIDVSVVARAFYDHPQQFNANDEVFVIHRTTITVEPPVVEEGEPVENGTVSIVDDEPVEEGPVLEEGGTPMSTWGEIIGYTTAFLMVVSLTSGGTFGNWSRRLQQWVLFRRAKRRVAFHNVVSYGLILTALVHMVLFLLEVRYPWTVGVLLGGTSILGMAGAGVTGAFQVPMIRRMGYGTWRWLHWLSFVVAFAAAAAHIALDGSHFTDFQERIGWEDPLAAALE